MRIVGDLSELFRDAGIGPEEDAPRASRPIDEAVIATLREIQERYSTGCPFKPGDMVTPRKGYNLKHAGEPHIVLEVFSEPIRFTPQSSDYGSTYYGSRLDMRVCCLSGMRNTYDYVCFCSESWCYEPFIESLSDAA